MALTNVTFDPWQVTDGVAGGAIGDNTLEAGGLLFTITAQGNWTADFNNNRFNFAEDRAFGSQAFLIQISKSQAATFTYRDFQISYNSSPLTSAGFPTSMSIGPISSLSDNLYSGGPRTLQSYFPGMTIGPVQFLELRDYNVNGGVNPTSTLWLDNIVADVNVNPIIAGLDAGDNFTYRATDGVVVIDRGTAISVSDADASGWSGGTLTLTIASGRGAGDVLGVGSGNSVSIANGTVSFGGTAIGSVAGGTGSTALVVTFNAQATDAAVAAVAHQLTFQNADAATTGGIRTLSLTVKDGGGASSAPLASTVTVIVPNHAPTLTATALNPAFVENGSGVALFSAPSLLTGDSGQTITQIVLTVSNVSDGAAEILSVGGTAVALTNGNNVATAVTGLSASVSVTGSTATVTLTKASGIAASVLSGITYSNTSDAPTGGSRDITLTSIKDNGGTADGGIDTTSLSIKSTVLIEAVNDAPTIAAPASLALIEAQATAVTGIVFADLDAGTLPVSARFQTTSGTLGVQPHGSVIIGGNGTADVTLTGSLAEINALILASKLVLTSPANGSASGTLTVSIDDGGGQGTGGAKSASTTVALPTTLVNDAPTLSLPAAQSTAVGSQLAFGAPIVVADPDAGNGNLAVRLSADHGTLSLTSLIGLTFSSGDGSADQAMTFEGTAVAINAALAALTFAPTAGYAGPATVSVSVDDLGQTGTGGPKTASGSIAVLVGTAPVVTTAAAQAAEGQAVSFTVSLSNAWGVPVSVDYATQDGTALSGSDYTAATGTLTFAPGETSKIITVTTATDALLEGPETFALALSNAAGLTIGTAAVTGTILDGTQPPAPPQPPAPTGTVTEVRTALTQVLPGLVSPTEAQAVADAIARGELTFTQFVDQIVEKAQPTVVPSLIVSDLLGGAAPTQQHLAELATFASAQLAAYTAAGVPNPTLGVYEALGLGNSQTIVFQQTYGALDQPSFLNVAYQNVFGRAATPAQIEHFAAQIQSFEALYRSVGQSAADAFLHAKGAVVGQMIGHAVLDEPQLHGFDDAANSFLKQAATGQANYGDPLAII